MRYVSEYEFNKYSSLFKVKNIKRDHYNDEHLKKKRFI